MAIIANSENIHDKEVMLLKSKLKRTQFLCKTIWNYRDYIEEIKDYISSDQLIGAGELWNELDYNIQKLLITAPLYGGPFTTEEVKKIKSVWEISVSDIEDSNAIRRY